MTQPSRPDTVHGVDVRAATAWATALEAGIRAGMRAHGWPETSLDDLDPDHVRASWEAAAILVAAITELATVCAHEHVSLPDVAALAAGERDTIDRVLEVPAPPRGGAITGRARRGA